MRVPSKSVFKFNEFSYLKTKTLIIRKLMTKNCMWPLLHNCETWHYVLFFDKVNMAKRSRENEGPSEFPQAK